MNRFYVGQRVVWWNNNQRALATVQSINHDYGSVTIAIPFRNRHDVAKVYIVTVHPSTLLATSSMTPGVQQQQ